MKIIGRFGLVSVFITPVRSIGCTSKLMKMWGESMIAGMEKKHVINLTPKERRRCLAIVSKGRNKASMIRQEAYLIALACSTPPAGQKRWTAELLAQQLMDDAIVDTVSTTTIRTVLKKTSLNLGE